MPKTTFQKLLLIALIAVMGATVASVARAEAPGNSEKMPYRISAPGIGVPMCPMSPAMTPIDAAGTGQARQTPIPGRVFDERYRHFAARISHAPHCVNSHIPLSQTVRS